MMCNPSGRQTSHLSILNQELGIFSGSSEGCAPALHRPNLPRGLPAPLVASSFLWWPTRDGACRRSCSGASFITFSGQRGRKSPEVMVNGRGSSPRCTPRTGAPSQHRDVPGAPQTHSFSFRDGVLCTSHLTIVPHITVTCPNRAKSSGFS